METPVRWGILWAGLGALAVVTIIGVLLGASSAGNGNNNTSGVFLVALLPIGATIAGAILLAGRDPEMNE